MTIRYKKGSYSLDTYPIADATAIVLTERFARRHNLTIGSSIRLIIGDARREFIVRGLRGRGR